MATAALLDRHGADISNRLATMSSPRRGEPPTLFGMKPVNEAAPLTKLGMKLAAAGSAFAEKVADTNSSLAGPVQRADIIRGHQAKLIPELKAAAPEIGAAIMGLQRERSEISFTRAYGSGPPGHAPLFDLEVAKAFAALPASEKAARIAMLKREPSDLALLDAVQRVPVIVTGISIADREAMRVAAVRRFMPTEMAVLDARVEQVNFALSALRTVIATVDKAVGTRADLVEHVPEALTVASTDTGKLLAWPSTDD